MKRKTRLLILALALLALPARADEADKILAARAATLPAHQRANVINYGPAAPVNEWRASTVASGQAWPAGRAIVFRGLRGDSHGRAYHSRGLQGHGRAYSGRWRTR